ncbi:GNAT family N-acetyltransferase [Pelomonas sp. V22]|uniref:GNAT family N-acetyltransferase n=1 Tax=Pelomonas sp. V22 TaxID=2822139 RepID=UPI0024A8C956|nr:GNAT family protein [Pelomonas sp. V22]MDI4634437.1 GNAT family N-acetyltransferase [Pelomonas sp. V22]
MPANDLISIAPVAASDQDELLAFELHNRRFFETWVNPRPPSYYAPDGVSKAIRAAQLDAEQDRAYQYLVREAGLLVGRINLSQVLRLGYQSASLGYRIGQDHNGRGIAQAAVKLALAEAFGRHGLWRIEATCRPENPASQRVLQVSGFQQFGHARRCFQLNGQWFDLLHFETHADAWPPM